MLIFIIQNSLFKSVNLNNHHVYCIYLSELKVYSQIDDSSTRASQFSVVAELYKMLQKMRICHMTLISLYDGLFIS